MLFFLGGCNPGIGRDRKVNKSLMSVIQVGYFLTWYLYEFDISDVHCSVVHHTWIPWWLTSTVMCNWNITDDKNDEGGEEVNMNEVIFLILLLKWEINEHLS